MRTPPTETPLIPMISALVVDSRWPLRWLARPVACLAAVGVVWAVLAGCPAAWGQREPVHYFHSAELPPGTIGPGQLLRGGPLPGYFQPVELRVPAGGAISVAMNGEFQPPVKDSVLVSLLIGPVYSLKITGIPLREGAEVFPSIEIINRLYPPPGLAPHFPIPIEFTAEELDLALSGRLVMRVIYLEDPQDALAVRDKRGAQRFVDVMSDEDPLQVADRLGRPMAILRMGSRIPPVDAAGRMLVASPPLQLLPKPGPLPSAKEGLEPAPPPPPQGPGRNPPRLPVSHGWRGEPSAIRVQVIGS
jgi:hypothetical protein